MRTAASSIVFMFVGSSTLPWAGFERPEGGCRTMNSILGFSRGELVIHVGEEEQEYQRKRPGEQVAGQEAKQIDEYFLVPGHFAIFWSSDFCFSISRLASSPIV